MRDEELAQLLVVDPSSAERLVEAAVAAGELRLQGELGNRRDRTRRKEQCVAELEERVAPAGEGAIEGAAEPSQVVAAGVDS